MFASGVSENTVRKYAKQYSETGVMTVKRPAGRPKKLTVLQRQQLAAAALQHNFQPNGKFKQILSSLP